MVETDAFTGGAAARSPRTKPLLLLDVDGPLNPYRQLTKKDHLPVKERPGEPRFTYTRHHVRPTGWTNPEKPPLPILVAAEHGEKLRELAEVYTLIWATTWVEEDTQILAPLYGLRPLPVIEWPHGANELANVKPPNHRGSWKTHHILSWLDEFARDRDGRVLPWVWVDDEINAADRALVRQHYGYARGETPTVASWLLRIEPSQGLRRGDFDDLLAWAQRNS